MKTTSAGQKFPIILIVLIMIAVCTACTEPSANAVKTAPVQNDTTTSSQLIRESATVNRIADTLRPKIQDASFVIGQSSKDDNPMSSIAVKYRGRTTTIANIAGEAALIEGSDYSSKQIPAKAIAACGAWWAGAGDYFYLLESADGVLVYQGWQEEMQSGSDYHWKKVKEIK
ncbi:MAG: hypothetical protein IT257_02790 [Chitinophagaceae bacterium]|nr:hypothetical protein [Chitinophagaceae bacterium]